MYYEHVRPPARIVRVPINGGTETRIAANAGYAAAGKMTISPDGKYLAYRFMRFGAESGVRVAVISTETGTTVQEMASGEGMSLALWSPDGKNLYFVRSVGGTANVWERSKTGNAEGQVTKFGPGGILDFAWSADGTTLYVVRGEETSDVVLMRNPN